MAEDIRKNNPPSEKSRDDERFMVNELQLSLRQWFLVGVSVVVVLVLLPWIWRRLEPFIPDVDYRIPYALSENYWFYDRYCRQVVSQTKTLVIGDSVIWGQYVSRKQTLPQYLNALTNSDEYANMGVNGTHPTALAGLVEHYGKPISNGRVILHCNPLWLATPKHDLSSKEPFHFNHPALVPQFIPSIPCYEASYAERIKNVLDRTVPYRAWTRHLQVAYFENTDMPTWTIEHPYRNPIKVFAQGLSLPNDQARQKPISWLKRGISRQDFEWVDLSASLQWRSFQHIVKILRQRGNRIFVLVGPFNEHMLEERSLAKYSRLKSEIGAWLQQEGLPYSTPAPLPSDHYGDASHPLSEGYARLAQLLLESGPYHSFLSNGGTEISR